MHKIKKCIFEMFSDRGYNYDKNINFELDKFKIYFDNSPCLLKFILDDLKSSQIKDIVNSVLDEYEDSFKTIFVVVIHNSFTFNNPKIEILYSKNFRLNITKHILCYKHNLVNGCELEKLKQNVKISNLPIIFENDPMVRWYGWKEGQVCKIHRTSDFYYRLIKKKIL